MSVDSKRGGRFKREGVIEGCDLIDEAVDGEEIAPTAPELQWTGGGSDSARVVHLRAGDSLDAEPYRAERVEAEFVENARGISGRASSGFVEAYRASVNAYGSSVSIADSPVRTTERIPCADGGALSSSG